MKKKSSKRKSKFHPLYHPMYGINNWCSIRAAAIEEIEEQESSKKSKPREKYVSLENAVMRRIIDSRRRKTQQKKKLASNNDEPVLNSEKIQESIKENIPVAIKEKVQPEIPATIINQVKKIKEALTLTDDTKKEEPTITPSHIPSPSPTPSENKKVARYASNEGLHSTADGIASHAEGLLTHAMGPFSHAEGSKTTATGHSSHSEGSETTASGSYSHAEGKHTIALGEAAHAEGTATIANGFSSHAEGNHTSTAHFAGSHIMGRFGTAEESYSWFIANGTNETDHNIGAKWLAHNGEMYIDGASYNASGTDFAQMFETVDNTLIDVGYFVTFSSEEKIRIATSNDSFILGISSATPALIGNSGALSWQKRYKTDSFGKRQYVRTESQDIQPLLNTEWDPACKYIARKDRTEWLPVGLIGQMLVRDDGTCETHGYCRPNDEGIATKSESGFFVIKRTDENQVLILFR
ncbi:MULTISPECIES: peptidase G2 autoproteolytic cleavage domain-containing protein [Bacillus cereus group]|uniref:peptidase G2 autoproteolytic cleavage domain-containing protein n=1 Tax=Bacillus cereus group TaxID=86661 RepID=UPI0022E3E482|nr:MULTISPECIES: peptidase G2 autoproteolytic cleavage domain-containing protein [Bacillus cereus group]MDA2026234.1 peptidase G2 [Bacillus cereus group sp. Bcc03]MDA2216066.1 peptidase G2 [Bacillus cereus group sp. Bc228]MDA2227669.1 peptidase G2 [Bacillus cereus group sp. Bc227]MDA2712937.1 peptidase G2 [Bacillus cereus group sp. Bc025]WJE71986.1 peptidase G2 autoproteolytic cleavage domain-containing protein [Bacillus albus]